MKLFRKDNTEYSDQELDALNTEWEIRVKANELEEGTDEYNEAAKIFSDEVSRRTHDTMMINKVEIKIYPASIQSDMKEWFNPSLILIAEVKLGECNEYGCNDKILTIKDQEGNEIYKNTGDLGKDINLLLKLYENLGWKDYEAFSLFETNNAYGFLSKAREELEK